MQDLIGRKEIVNQISALINNLSKDEHFCLAHDGGWWDSGKIFALRILEEHLKTNKEYVIVKYDAWGNRAFEVILWIIINWQY